jgi:hypothetical protein
VKQWLKPRERVGQRVSGGTVPANSTNTYVYPIEQRTIRYVEYPYLNYQSTAGSPNSSYTL